VVLRDGERRICRHRVVKAALHGPTPETFRLSDTSDYGPAAAMPQAHRARDKPRLTGRAAVIAMARRERRRQTSVLTADLAQALAE